MARGSIGRERMLSGVVGMTAHQPPTTGHQEDLNNELLAVSFCLSIDDFLIAIDDSIVNSKHGLRVFIKHLLIVDAAKTIAIKFSATLLCDFPFLASRLQRKNVIELINRVEKSWF